MDSWNKYFLDIAGIVASKSKVSTKVGCVIVDPNDMTILATGYNGAPSGIADNDYVMHGPYKKLFVEHAETNAVLGAARRGASLRGSRAYLTLPPCFDCARAMIRAGVSVIITTEDLRDQKDRDAEENRWWDVERLLDTCGVHYYMIYDDSQLWASEVLPRITKECNRGHIDWTET